MTETFSDGHEWFDALPERLQYLLEGVIIYDDYYEAILGYTLVEGVFVLVYSSSGIVDSLVRDFKESPVTQHGQPMPDEDVHEEAVEYFSFNVAGGWLGDRTPLLLADMGDPDDDLVLTKLKKRLPGLIGRVERCSKPPALLFQSYAWPMRKLRWNFPDDGGEIELDCYELFPICMVHMVPDSDLRDPLAPGFRLSFGIGRNKELEGAGFRIAGTAEMENKVTGVIYRRDCVDESILSGMRVQTPG